MKGTLNPLNYQLTGTGSLAQLQIEKFPVNKIDFHWNVDPNQLRLTEISSQLFAGTIAGEAAIPLKPEAAGTIDLKLKKVNLGNLSQSVPTTANLRLEGQAEGFLKATVHPVKNQEPRQTELDADIRADHLKVRGIAADKLHATAKLQRSILQYKLEAAALGGTIELDGRYPPTPDAETKKIPNSKVDCNCAGYNSPGSGPASV